LKTLHLFPQPNVESGPTIKRVCCIKRFDGPIEISDEELWFEIDRIDELPADDDCESYLLSMLMEGMAENREIVVHGAVSKELLSNLTEFQDVWVSWRPEKYNRVSIYVERLTLNSKIKSGAICAFSGGVDASFSVWRNTENRNGARTQAICLCAMVHGFDIPIDDARAFHVAFSRAEATLSSLDLTIRAIRTNYRNISKLDWNQTHGAALVGALSNYKGLAGVCVLASGEPYSGTLRPWGSSPITDHLLSSGELAVVHDGASHTRTQKVLALSEWPAGFENLKVCWEGEFKDRNCGKCEKCVRTMLNIAANNLPIPPCFPSRVIILDDVKKLELKNEVVRGEWRQIRETAKRNGISADWVRVVEKKLEPRWFETLSSKINWQPLKDLLFPDGTTRKRIATKIYLFSKRLD